MSFNTLKLSPQIIQALKKQNFKEPTPIQEKMIPLVFEKQDIMAKAKTGSGKSASYILPILDMITKRRDSKKAKIKALILTPTIDREQITGVEIKGEAPKKIKGKAPVKGKSKKDKLREMNHKNG